MFNASLIPPMYYPTCVMLIDDSETFLMSLSLGLDEDIPYLTRSAPRPALEELQHRLFQPASGDLESLLADSNRFNGVSVAVVDKSMPAIDGLELCACLDHSRVKTILLTGIADVSPALQAMQAGVIDAYINKGELSALHKLNYTIKEFSAQLFLSAYQNRFVRLGKQQELLKKTDFSRVFHALCKQYAIVEFYLLEDGLRFLMLDEKAHAYVLSFHEQAEAVLAFSDSRFSADVHAKPESIVSLSYYYACSPVKPNIPIYSFATYMKEVWSSQH